MAQAAQEDESIAIVGELVGHSDWVTCVATAPDQPNMLLTGSRDKTIVVWELTYKTYEDNKGKDLVKVEAKMKKRLVGHNHFISDLSVFTDNSYALSASWDGTLRLWNLKKNETEKIFSGHKKDILSVAISPDSRKIVSGARDHRVCVWNTAGKKITEAPESQGHTDWVTCVRFSPNKDEPIVVSASRDKTVKVWDVSGDDKIVLKHNLAQHTKYVNSVTVSPDGSLCASGGKDGLAILWDLNEGKMLSSLEADGEIMALCFSPNRYWLCGAVLGDVDRKERIKIWDLETKIEIGQLTIPPRDENTEETRKKVKKIPVLCTCLTWSHDGRTLFAGYSDKSVRIWALLPGADNQQIDS